MGSARGIGGWVAAIVGLAGTLAAQESYAEARAELFRASVERVEELVDWTQERRLYLERDRLCEALIALAPDHAEARKFLRYKRTKEGWERESYRAPQNRSAQGLAEFEGLRAELVALWRDELGALHARFEAELSEAEREHLWDDLLILAPDDAEARSQRGEVRASSGAWVLQETEAARARRAHLFERATALAAAEPAIAEVATAQDEAAMGWESALASDDVRLFGSCESPEARIILRDAQAAVTLFRDVFGEVPILPSDFTLYVLSSEPAKGTFLAKHPRADETVRWAARDLDGAWLRGAEALAIWHADREARLQQIVRETIQHMLVRSYGLDPQEAWALEGFGLLLAELATNRPDLEVHAPKTSVEPRAKARKENQDLWSAARDVVTRGDRPLGALLERPREEFAREDVLHAYAFARFLCEAHGKRLARLLDDLGNGDVPAAEGLRDVTGLELAALEHRFERWVAELER